MKNNIIISKYNILKNCYWMMLLEMHVQHSFFDKTESVYLQFVIIEIFHEYSYVFSSSITVSKDLILSNVYIYLNQNSDGV